METCATSMISRRSHTSAAAPAGSENSMMGRTVDTWTRATMSAEGASDVISQVAPTFCTRLPKFDRRLAIHMARKMRERNGENADGAEPGCVLSAAGRPDARSGMRRSSWMVAARALP